ncbi:peptide chain release factor N(5)-glutamine methyltransferase, partial [Francisella tularensis subsp. holarctica]|nr:peptide chain release factor N(5)-glutamine methyltransferase [Francisella tularensis subsp. holarctica]
MSNITISQLLSLILAKLNQFDISTKHDLQMIIC